MIDNLAKSDKKFRLYDGAQEGIVGTYVYYTCAFETVLRLKVKSGEITMRSNPAIFLIIFDILSIILLYNIHNNV